jgi:hypothetical protein
MQYPSSSSKHGKCLHNGPASATSTFFLSDAEVVLLFLKVWRIVRSRYFPDSFHRSLHPDSRMQLFERACTDFPAFRCRLKFGIQICVKNSTRACKFATLGCGNPASMIANVKSGWYIFMRDHLMNSATSCGLFLLLVCLVLFCVPFLTPLPQRPSARCLQPIYFAWN